jgi:hypothetical protein
MNYDPFGFYLLSFEFCVLLWCLTFLPLLILGAVLRLKYDRKQGGYFLAGGLGSLIGFALATAPYIHTTLETHLVSWSGGGAYYRWPPPWLPVSVDWVSPFVGYAAGSVFGFVVGIWCLASRARKKHANRVAGSD